MALESTHDLRQRIHMFFDNELDNEGCQSLLHKVATDPHCGTIFQKEKNFREYIKSNVKRPSVSPDLIQTIKERIKIV